MSNDFGALSNDLRAAGKTAHDQAAQAVRRSGIAVQNGARTRATVDTGFMRSSIQMTTQDGGLTAVIDAGAEYAVFQEFGTSRNVPAVMFMGNSLDQVRPEFEAAMQQVGVNIL